MGSSGCRAGAVPSKQAKQTSKGLVFDAVRVLGAGVVAVQWRFLCCEVKQISKVMVLGSCAGLSKQR